jgi:hypothetical protein
LEISFLNINDLIGQDFSNSLERSESMLSDTLGDEVDGLIDSSQWGHINCLLSDDTSSANSGGIFSGTSLDNGVNKHFKRVSSSKEMDDFKSMSHNSDGFNLFTSVSSVELEGSYKSLNNWA